MNNNNNAASVTLGSIFACIAGDLRYSTTIRVTVLGDDAFVTTSENGAVGGMDGDGRSHPFEDRGTSKCKATAADIVRTVKWVIRKEQCHIVKTYGKPSKRFWWKGLDERGLSVRLCQRALDAVKVNNDLE
jgi:hypothetical protein